MKVLHKSTGGEGKINEFDWFPLCDYFLRRVLRLRILKEATKKRQSEEKVCKEREKRRRSPSQDSALSPPTTNFLSLSSLVISDALCGSANHRLSGNFMVEIKKEKKKLVGAVNQDHLN